MSNLNKIKEEGEKDIRSNKTNFTVYGELGIGVNYTNLIDWHNKQMDKVFSLAIDEVVEIVDNVNVEVFDERIDESVVDVVEKIVMQTRDVIKQKLLSLKNKNI